MQRNPVPSPTSGQDTTYISGCWQGLAFQQQSRTCPSRPLLSEWGALRTLPSISHTHTHLERSTFTLGILGAKDSCTHAPPTFLGAGGEGGREVWLCWRANLTLRGRESLWSLRSRFGQRGETGYNLAAWKAAQLHRKVPALLGSRCCS